LRVLAVDDNDTNLQVMKNLCEVLGLNCELAHHGAEAVELVRAAPYDLILMDICMPIMDGVEATLAIRSLSGPGGRTPIVAVTANAEKADIQRYLAAGIGAVVSKPVVITDLMSAMQAALDPEVATAAAQPAA
jgi:CheY-like chemotaxis protein